MALIDCKNCGNKVSDTAVRCPHCGFDLQKAKMQEKKRGVFVNLPLDEQENLIKDFYKAHPAYQNLDDKFSKYKHFKKIADIVSWIGIGLIIVFGVIFYMTDGSFSNMNFLGVMLILSVIFEVGGDIFVVIFSILLTRINRMMSSVEKKKQHWLKEVKGIDYQPKITQVD